MISYKIYINDRNYSSWEVFDTNNFNKINVDIDPIKSKLFSNDVFTLDEQLNVNILHSSIRLGTSMPGVLILTGNKTYGRQNKQTPNKKRNEGKLLYKCIPDDIRMPSFLVPYELKNVR